MFIDYITYFNSNRDYFECHEVLEEYWKDIAPRNKEHVLVGYVQIATGMYHWRRNNFNGAQRIFAKGLQTLQTQRSDHFVTAFAPTLFDELEVTLNKMGQQQPFEAFTLPIADPIIQQLVDKRAARGLLQDLHFITHKHMLRDRSEVLDARAAKIASKQK